jgi:gamma-glutamylcyclotransferase (GGCT)/AIG2-like uncharacterized protein YtfP
VFVYGTLLAGESNHRVLGDSECLGRAVTRPGFRFVDCGYYPAALTDGETAIVGEVYRVNEVTLERLDYLESVPRLYDRKLIELADGSVAWIYLLNPAGYLAGRDLPGIPGGDWRAYLDEIRCDRNVAN